nr:hypothetical protein [Azospirillum brasilense]
MPDLVGVLRQDDPLDLALAGLVEQAQLDLLGVRGEQGEVDPEPVPVRPQRIGLAGPDGGARGGGDGHQGILTTGTDIGRNRKRLAPGAAGDLAEADSHLLQ